MPDVLDRLGAALLDASLAAIVITGLVILVMVQCRQPARRLKWARAGLLSTLALIPLAGLNPVPRIDLRGSIRQLLPTGLDEPSPYPEPRSEGSSHRGLAQGLVGPEPRPRPQPRARPPGTPRWSRWVGRGLVVAYGVGVSLGLGSILLGLCGSAWLIRRSRKASIASLDHYRTLHFAGRTARPGLLVSERATRPVLIGIARPVILIPSALDEPKSRERLRLSLLHELAHAEELDHWFCPVATLAQALWFFLPPVWWIRDQMKLDQEFLADRRAVAHFGTSGSYASSLVALASGSVSDHEEWPEPPSDEASGDVESRVTSTLIQRIQMLLKCPFAIEGKSPPWWRWSAALTLGLATLAASCLTIQGVAGWPRGAIVKSRRDLDRLFQISDLVIRQREQDDQPFDLRFRLPDQFVLSFEIMAEPADLSSVEVLGHRLNSTLDLDPSKVNARTWHRVEIRRVEGGETLRIDDRPVAKAPKPIKLASWLTVRPGPGQTARLRDLLLAW